MIDGGRRTAVRRAAAVPFSNKRQGMAGGRR
jgi:hypothetical protein